MKGLEFLRNESLSRQEQAAFSEAADALIFETPANFKLSRKKVPELSRLIQESFRTQDQSHEKTKHEFVDDLLEKTIREARESLGIKHAEEPEEAPPQTEEKKVDDRSLTEQVVTAARFYIGAHGKQYWQSQGYSAWGFTPKLAAMRTKEYERPYEKDGKNCFGVVQGLGAFFNEMGLPIEMGITADHPFVVVEIEHKTYLASLYGIEEAKGTFETRDGYKMYTPSKEDKLPYKLMTVWNFDDALVYELLENLEVLRQMSLGKEVENLPGSKESGVKLSEIYRETLQKTSWRTLQEHVTPHLAAYFHDHSTEWAAEQERIVIEREINHLFSDVMDLAQAATSMKDLSFEDFKKKFLPIAKEHSQSIVNFIISGVECGPDTPSDVVLFAQVAGKVFNAILIPELRTEVIRIFLRPFMEKSETAPLTDE